MITPDVKVIFLIKRLGDFTIRTDEVRRLTQFKNDLGTTTVDVSVFC